MFWVYPLMVSVDDVEEKEHSPRYGPYGFGWCTEGIVAEIRPGQARLRVHPVLEPEIGAGQGERVHERRVLGRSHHDLDDRLPSRGDAAKGASVTGPEQLRLARAL